MILFLFEMKKTDTLIFPWNLLQTRIWIFDLLIPVSGSFPSHCTLSRVTTRKFPHPPVTSHRCCQGQREPKTGSKEEGRVDRPEATDTVTRGDSMISLAGLKGKGIVSLNHSDFPNRVFPKLQPLTSYLYKFCCACLPFMLFLLDIFFKETQLLFRFVLNRANS